MNYFRFDSIYLVYIMESAGYIDKKIIAIDGAKIKASANKRFWGTIEEYNADI